MSLKDLSKRKIYLKQYNKKNKNRLTQWRKEYYQKNKQRIIFRVKQYVEKNREKINEKNRLYRQRNLSTWEGYIPKETNCPICNKKIYFNKKYCRDAIHFDHRHENTSIKKSPFAWIETHKRTPENQKIWELCDFGMLCKRCNGYLRTKNRAEFINKIIKYVFGDNAKIVI